MTRFIKLQSINGWEKLIRIDSVKHVYTADGKYLEKIQNIYPKAEEGDLVIHHNNYEKIVVRMDLDELLELLNVD